MIHKNYFLLLFVSLICFVSTSYTIFDRPANENRGPGFFEVDYTNKYGETRRRFAPIESVFGGRNQTDKNYPSVRRYPQNERYYNY